MGVIEREHQRIAAALPPSREADPEMWDRLYAAQQALTWASDPNMYASPYEMIVGKSNGEPRPPPFGPPSSNPSDLSERSPA